MSRADLRAQIRENQKLAKEINKLTPNQLKLIDKITEFRTNEIIEVYKELVDKSVFETMRANRVGVERANRIMDQANEVIVEATK